MHSAEWYRGAVAALEDCEYSSFEATMNQTASYRRQLAEAEAREAGETSAEVVSTVRSELLKCLDNAKTLPQDARQAGVVAGWELAVDLLEALCEAGEPSLAAQLAAAQAEVKERTTMAARAQEAMRYLLNGLPATDAIWAAYGNADSARAWLAARDARIKALGAAEWIQREYETAKQSSRFVVIYEAEFLEREAAQLRQQSEAARLAEGE